MHIRAAKSGDADEIAQVLRRSIRELCILDHRGDAKAMEEWLYNKTAENIRLWIEASDRHIVVAEENERILGVGGASQSGEIILNYVAPEVRFKGISKSIVAALEAYLRTLGLQQCKLTSTRTAHAFYIALGYENTKDSTQTCKAQDLKMHRLL